MSPNYQPCSQLRVVSDNKKKLYEESIIKKCEKCSVNGITGCDKCVLSFKLINRYCGGNIPIDFINRSISGFSGDPKLIKLYNTLTEDLAKTYESGDSLLLLGSHGVGKTFFSCMILKRVLEKGYSGLYTTLSDVVEVLLHADYTSKSNANRELKMIDFLVIDEFDARYVNTENSGVLFGRILEQILRIRLQNYMPTILITNNPDPTKSLGEALGASITSLINGYMKKIPVVGKDFRTVK